MQVAMTRRLRRARFEQQATLETFDFHASPKLPAAQIRDLAALRWLAAGEFGDPAMGRSGSAKATSPRPSAISPSAPGAEVSFAKTSRALATLAGGHADRTWDKRLAELTRPPVLILDDFAVRELTAPQSDGLYELVTARAAAVRASCSPPTGPRSTGMRCSRPRHGLFRHSTYPVVR